MPLKDALKIIAELWTDVIPQGLLLSLPNSCQGLGLINFVVSVSYFLKIHIKLAKKKKWKKWFKKKKGIAIFKTRKNYLCFATSDQCSHEGNVTSWCKVSISRSQLRSCQLRTRCCLSCQAGLINGKIHRLGEHKVFHYTQGWRLSVLHLTSQEFVTLTSSSNIPLSINYPSLLSYPVL